MNFMPKMNRRDFVVGAAAGSLTLGMRIPFDAAEAADGAPEVNAWVVIKPDATVDSFSQELETQALDLFGELIGRADDKARMDRALYAKDDLDAGLRAARRLGGDQPAIAKARISVLQNASNAKAQLDAVPAAARHDAGYVFARTQWLRRHDKIAEAGALLLTTPRDPDQLANLDEWWIERRLVARKLLDLEDYRTAYRIARDAEGDRHHRREGIGDIAEGEGPGRERAVEEERERPLLRHEKVGDLPVMTPGPA